MCLNRLRTQSWKLKSSHVSKLLSNIFLGDYSGFQSLLLSFLLFEGGCFVRELKKKQIDPKSKLEFQGLIAEIWGYPWFLPPTSWTPRLVLIRLRHSEEAGKGTDERIVGGFSNLPTVRFYS